MSRQTMSHTLAESTREDIDKRVAAGNCGDTSESIRELVRRDRLKPAVFRPQALRDQQGEVRFDRKEGDTRVAVKLSNDTHAALDQLELDPGVGSPTLGKLLGIPGLRTWRVAKFPLLWCCFECKDRLDVVRLLGERQNIAAILGDEFTSNGRQQGRGERRSRAR